MKRSRIGRLLALAAGWVSLVVPGSSAQGAEFQPVAARLEGYLGWAHIDSVGVDPDAFSGGGVGSASLWLAPLAAQLDVFGDRADYDHSLGGIHKVGIGVHLGLRDPELGAIAFSSAWNRTDLETVDLHADVFRVGGEAEVYLGAVTLGVNAGLVEVKDDSSDGYYARAVVRVYPQEDLKLEIFGGAGDSPNDGLDPDVIARALLEYRLVGLPVSIFGRWEADFNDDLIDIHQVVGGIRLYFDGERTLRASDREAFFDSCTGGHIALRNC